MKKVALYIAVPIAIGAIVVGCLALSAWLTQWAWNMVIAGLFSGPVLEFWHAVAVVVLVSIVGSAMKSNVSTKS